MTVGPLSHGAAHWPERWNRPPLIGLADQADDVDVARAIVSTIGRAMSAEESLSELIRDGHFQLAERILDRQDEMEGLPGIEARLQEARAAAQSAMESRIELLSDRMSSAGLEWHADRQAFITTVTAHRGSAEEWFDDLERSAIAAIGTKSEDLLRQAKGFAKEALHPDQVEPWLDEIRAALTQGDLRTVETVMLTEDPDPAKRGPSFIPHPPILDQLGPIDNALDALLSDTLAGSTPAFRKAFQSEPVRELARLYRSLDGSEASAQAMSDLIVEHLRGDQAPVTADPEGAGHVAPFYALRHDDVIQHLALREGAVNLWMGGAGVRKVPESVPGLVMAVGPALSKQATRSSIAVLGFEDLVRMLVVRSRPHIALLRVAGAQWPARMLMPIDDVAFDQALGVDKAERIATISWLVDLTGLGGLTESSELVHVTGTLPGLVRLLIEDRARRGTSEWNAEVITDEEHVLSGIPSVVTADRAAFWMAIEMGSFGEWISIDDTLELVGAAYELEHPPTLERLRSGLDKLGRHRVVELEEARFRVPHIGFARQLTPGAERRLRRELKSVEEAVARSSQDFLHKIGSVVDKLTRHELRAIARYRSRLIDEQGDSEAINALDERAKALRSTHVATPGGFDARELLQRVKREVETSASGTHVEIRGDDCPELAVSGALFTLIFTELCRNAVEINEHCIVQIDIRARESSVVFVVADNGQGIDPEFRAQVMRSGQSGRGSSGDGLSLIRVFLGALDPPGEIELLQEPALAGFGGAQFRLYIPRL